MKNWLKENWFKISILATVFIFETYYLLVVTRNQQIRVAVDSCRKIGEEYGKNEIEENPKLSFFTSMYAYNKKLDACIYSGSFMNTTIIGKHNITKYIKNLNTNKEIVGSSYIENQKMFGVHRLEFDEKESELFSKN